MYTIARFSIEEVLPFTGAKAPNRIYSVKGREYKVKMASLRYQTFAKSLNCTSCGLTGDIFLLQYHPSNPKNKTCHDKNCSQCDLKMRFKNAFGNETPHFNLYHVGRYGGLVLMTKDHIYPKSKGGKDHIDNLETMCVICNMIKSDSLPGELIPENIII